MPHGHGLVQQSLNVDKVALSTLGARSAIQLNSQMTSPATSFLMKRIRYFLQLTGRTTADDGPILIGVARGDATIAEIEASMNERNTNGPEDITSMLDQDLAWIVYQNTVVPMIVRGDQTFMQMDSYDWQKFGGKNGIPALEATGLQIFAYNSGVGALVTGAEINGQAYLQGVWLRD